MNNKKLKNHGWRAWPNEKNNEKNMDFYNKLHILCRRILMNYK